MYNDTTNNILASFAYLNENEDFCNTFFGLHRQGVINGMLDSGAFTIHNNPKQSRVITIDTYCKFLDKFGDFCEKYVMLDVIGNAEASRRNYEIMINRGYNPMWVATVFDNDFEYMAEAVKRNHNICVAGGSKLKSTWMCQRFQRVFNNTGKAARIHALGYVTQPLMYQLPLASVDSSTWNTGCGAFGRVPIFKPGKGIGSMSWREMLSGEPITREIKDIFERLSVTPSMIKKENFVGSISIARFASIYCHLQMQRYAKRCGLDYFLAVGSGGDLRDIMWLIENWHNLDYQKFRKFKNK